MKDVSFLFIDVVVILCNALDNDKRVHSEFGHIRCSICVV